MPEDASAAASRFSACLDVVLAHEGGYSDHPEDPGGATNLGITRATLAAWRGVAVDAIPKGDVKALTKREASEIYRALYWTRCAGDRLPPGLDLAVFDYAVNSGPERAVKALQQALGVKADGIAGPVTLGALAARKAKIDALVKALCDGRMSFLQRLSTFATFGRGWASRVATIRRLGLQMAAAASPKRQQRSPSMNLTGYRTYIIATLMALVAAVQLMGIDLPSLDGHSAGHLLMEAFAIIFLRKGIENAARP